MAHAVGKIDAPLQSLHTAQAAADNRRPLLYAEIIGQHGLADHPVFYGYHRKIGAVFFAGFGVDAQGAGAAVATAQVVQADYKKAVGVDRFAGADHIVPPAGCFILLAVVARHMVMAG